MTQILLLPLQSECESKEKVLDAKTDENASLQKLVDKQSEQLNVQLEEILMLKRLFING